MMALGSIPSGTYTGNAIDEILISGPNADVFADMTVADYGVPVRIPFGSMNIGPAVGSTAAFEFGMHEDQGLIAAGLVGAWMTLPPRRRRRRTQAATRT